MTLSRPCLLAAHSAAQAFYVVLVAGMMTTRISLLVLVQPRAQAWAGRELWCIPVVLTVRLYTLCALHAHQLLPALFCHPR